MIVSNGEAGMPGVVVASVLGVLGLVGDKFCGTTLLLADQAPEMTLTPMLYLTEVYPNHLADPMDLLWVALAIYGAASIAKKSSTT